jgi:DNA-binding beta-propeller fold protein YncE
MMNGSVWNTYGSKGSGIGQFEYLYGCYYDNSSDHIYIADGINDRIVKTKMGGSGWTSYGTLGLGIGQFDHPTGIYFDRGTGFIYIADNHNCRIVKTMINGSGWTTLGTKWGSGVGEFWLPSDIDYDNITGFIYITDQNNCRIVKTKIDGSGWTTYGSYGNGTGQFKYPTHISYDKNTGYIYVADTNNNRIVKTMMNGTGWTTYGSSGTGKGQFYQPWGIYYDSNTDFVYVADTYNHRIVRTMMNGSGWTTYGTYGFGIGQFFYPTDVALGEEGYCPDGFLLSKEYYLNSSADILSINWEADIPLDTSIKFQIRTAHNRSALGAKNFVGPNGSIAKFYNSSGAKVWAGHHGDKWLQYKVYLATTNISKTPVLKNVTIIYNQLPERPILISPEVNAWIDRNSTTFTWQFGDNDSSSQKGFQWQLDHEPEFISNDHDYDSDTVISSKHSYTPSVMIPDGTWYWRVRAQDSDGGWGEYSAVRQLNIDTTPPQSEISEPEIDRFYNSVTSIQGTASSTIVSPVSREQLQTPTSAPV